MADQNISPLPPDALQTPADHPVGSGLPPDAVRTAPDHPVEGPPSYWSDLPEMEKNKSPKDRTLSVMANWGGVLPYIRAGVEAQNRGESFWGGTPRYESERKALQQYYNQAYENASDPVKVLSGIGLPGGPMAQAGKYLTSASRPIASAAGMGAAQAGVGGYLAPIEPATNDWRTRAISAAEAMPLGAAFGAGAGAAGHLVQGMRTKPSTLEETPPETGASTPTLGEPPLPSTGPYPAGHPVMERYRAEYGDIDYPGRPSFDEWRATNEPDITQPESASTQRPAPPFEQTFGAGERLALAKDMREAGIPQFAPALVSSPVARMFRTAAEVPLAGRVISSKQLAAENAARAAKENILHGMNAAPSAEEAGLIAQRGLDRFRTARLEDLPREDVQALGINPDRPPPRTRNAYVSIDDPENLSTRGMSQADLEALASSHAQLPGQTRTTVESLTPEETESLINAPDWQTSFRTKQAALYKRAEDAIPPMMQVNNAANNMQFATRNAASVVRGILRGEESMGITGGVTTGRFANLLQGLANPNRNYTLQRFRDVRTELGRAIDEYGDYDVGMRLSQLKQVYGALNQDYRQALIASAARARSASMLDPKDPRYITPETADQADRAARYFDTADRYTRESNERMDNFMTLLGAKNADQAGRTIAQYLRDKTSNTQALDTIASSLRPEEWKSVLGYTLDNLGKPTAGGKESEQVFSFSRFASDWNRLSQTPRIREIVQRGLGEENMAGIDRLARIAEGMKRYENLKNFSGTAYAGIAGAGLFGLLNPMAWPGLIGMTGGTMLAGHLLTSQTYVNRFLIPFYELQQKIGRGSRSAIHGMQQLVQSLPSIANGELDPNLRSAIMGSYLSMTSRLGQMQQGGDHTKPLPSGYTPRAAIDEARQKLARNPGSQRVKDAVTQRLMEHGLTLEHDPGALLAAPH